MVASLVPASLVALLTAVFGATVLGQYMQRPRPYKVAWAVGLFMAALAAASFVLFALTNGSDFFFRLYYIFGAALNIAWLGMGSLYLLIPARWAQRSMIVLTILSLIEAFLILTSPIHAQSLLQVADFYTKGTPIITVGVDAAGKQVLVEPGAWLVLVIILPIFGTLSLIGGAIVSAVRGFRQEGWSLRTASNVVIALGGLLIATAGSLVRYASGQGFWVMTSVGFAILFGGFLMTNRVMALLPAPSMGTIAAHPQK